MAFNTTSFFAGVGTVFAAVVLGFVGGTMITTSRTMEPNRVERLATTAAPATVEAPAKADPAEVPVAAKAPEEAAAAAPIDKSPVPPDRVISLTRGSSPPPASSSQPTPPPTANPVMARDDAEDDAAKTLRNDAAQRSEELRKAAAARAAERRAERRRERRRRDLQAAENAVVQIPRDDSPRFGFFGED